MPDMKNPDRPSPPLHSFDNSVAAISNDIIEKLFSMRAKFPEVATISTRSLRQKRCD